VGRIVDRLLVGVALAALYPACAHRPCPDVRPSPPALREPWASERQRDHPLVGHVYDVRAGRFVDVASLEAAAAAAHYLLLGETHDNSDHHRLQARLVRAVTASGRRPALAFEMLDTSQQGAVDAALAGPDRSADAVARAVGWARSGWPPFAIYRPVFAAGVEANLPIVAANLPRKVVRDVVESGRSALPEPLRESLARDEPLPPALVESLRNEMSASHCGKLPPEMFDPLVLAQRARDAEMAARLLATDTGQGSILVAGAGHVRADRGVPAYLAREAPRRGALAVAFLEVSPDKCSPDAYAEDLSTERLPFDYVVFTPGAEREDPCKAMHPRTRPPPAAPATTVMRCRSGHPET
jgi:uncharacterized iron-regulated protein